jgi:hypothetical protein
VPEEDAKHFERGFQEGGILVTVQAGEDAEEAREALSEDGADLGPSWSGYGEYEESEEIDETEEGMRIELMEEELDGDIGEVQADEVHEEARVEPDGDRGILSEAGQERRRDGSTQYLGRERRVASRR